MWIETKFTGGLDRMEGTMSSMCILDPSSILDVECCVSCK